MNPRSLWKRFLSEKEAKGRIHRFEIDSGGTAFEKGRIGDCCCCCYAEFQSSSREEGRAKRRKTTERRSRRSRGVGSRQKVCLHWCVGEGERERKLAGAGAEGARE